MNLLLDTHPLIWSLTNDPILTLEAFEVIKNLENTICISAASIWEIRIKQRKGKILKFPKDFYEHLLTLPFEILPMRLIFFL